MVLPLLSLSEGGVLHIVNGPTMDKKTKVPVRGFTVRLADKTLTQTWPSENMQVMPPYIEEKEVFIACLIRKELFCLRCSLFSRVYLSPSLANT